MCGIAGCFGTKDVTTINRMLDALPHRGPNDRGLHIHNHTVFGHTRLSIVDVAKGHQPITADEGRLGIICNGEIYNFKILRDKLSKYVVVKPIKEDELLQNVEQALSEKTFGLRV